MVITELIQFNMKHHLRPRLIGEDEGGLFA